MTLGVIGPKEAECLLCGLKFADGKDGKGKPLGRDTVLYRHLVEDHCRLMIEREDRKFGEDGCPVLSLLTGPRWHNDLAEVRYERRDRRGR